MGLTIEVPKGVDRRQLQSAEISADVDEFIANGGHIIVATAADSGYQEGMSRREIEKRRAKRLEEERARNESK